MRIHWKIKEISPLHMQCADYWERQVSTKEVSALESPSWERKEQTERRLPQLVCSELIGGWHKKMVYRQAMVRSPDIFQVPCGFKWRKMIHFLSQTRQQKRQVTTYLGGCCDEKERKRLGKVYTLEVSELKKCQVELADSNNWIQWHILG